MLSRDRAVFLRTANGSIEFTGGVEWRARGPENFSQAGVTLHLAVKSGTLDGKVFDFLYNDPY